MRHLPRVIWALTLTLTLPIRAADPTPPPYWPIKEFEALTKPPPPRTISPETSRLVAQLASDDYRTREIASQELAAKGPEAFPGLREAVAASTDPEVLARTRAALKPWTFKFSPDLPRTTVTLLHQYEDGRTAILERPAPAVATLPSEPGSLPIPLPWKSLGPDTELFIRILLQQEAHPPYQLLLQKLLAQRPLIEARFAIASGNLAEAQRLLREALPSEAHGAAADYAALIALRNGSEFDPQRELDAIEFDRAARDLHHHMGALLFRAKGKIPVALDFATRAAAIYPAPERILLIESRNYDSLPTNPPSWKPQSASFDPILLNLLAGNHARVDEILSGLRSNLQPPPPVSPYILPLINRFLTGDHADEAIQIALQQQGGAELIDPRTNIPFYLLCQQLRIREALATIRDNTPIDLDAVAQLNDLGLPAAARSMFRPGMLVNGRSDLACAVEFERMGASAAAAELRRRTFARAAEDEATMRALDARTRELDTLLKSIQIQVAELSLDRDRVPAAQGGDANIPDRRAMEMLLKTQEQQHLLEGEYARTAVERSQIESKRRQIQLLSPTITFLRDPALTHPESQREAPIWFDRILKAKALDPQTRYAKTLHLVNGDLTDNEADTLLADLLQPAAQAPFIPAIQDLSDLQTAVAAFHRMHRDAAAEKLITHWFAREKDPSCWALLGDIALDLNKPAEAFSYYRKAAVVNLTDATLMYRMGLALIRENKDRAAGEQLIIYAPLLVLGDSSMAHALADTMRRFQTTMKGDEWFDDYVRHFTAVQEPEYAECISRARNAAESRGDYAQALELQKQALFSPQQLHPADFSPIMANLALYHRLRALDALQRKDLPTLADALDRHLNNAPPDPDLLEKTLPTLRANNPEAAQKVLTRATDRLKPITEDYPEPTQYKTQLTRLQSLAK